MAAIIVSITTAATLCSAQPANTQTSGPQINKQPLIDFRNMVAEKVQKGEVDLTAPFSLTLVGRLNPEGKFDPKKSRFTKVEGNQQTAEIAKRGLEALSDSGYFQYLLDLKGKELQIALNQDEKEFAASVKSDVENQEKARRLSSAFNVFINMGKIMFKNKKETKLLEFMKAKNEEASFLLMLQMPQSDFSDMFKQMLEEKVAK